VCIICVVCCADRSYLVWPDTNAHIDLQFQKKNAHVDPVVTDNVSRRVDYDGLYIYISNYINLVTDSW
jgi:hypothetical protein